MVRGTPGARPTVLVVEDDEAVTRMLRFSLRTAGFDTAEAACGMEALRALEDGDMDAVVLDLGLPDGLAGAVLDRLRRPGGRGLPVWVVISALDCHEAAGRYGRLGCHFVGKPFDPWELASLLDRLLADRPVTTPADRTQEEPSP